MKKISALALLVAASASASAQSQTQPQSSVTLFGTLDVNAGSIKNGNAGSVRYLGSSGNETSRLGLRGTEDLGGGLRAGFWLEGELFPDTGNLKGMDWTRRSTVSLISNTLGELRLGRDYVPNYWTRFDFDPFGQNGIGSQGNMLVLNQPIQTSNQTAAFPGAVNATPLGSGAPTYKRSSNGVAYFLPGNLGGVYGQAMVAPGEGSPGLGKYVSGRLGYQTGPVNVEASYGKTTLTNPFADDLKEVDAGASYDFGIVKVMGQYDKYSYDQSLGTSDLKDWLIGATVPIGLGSVKLSYNKATISGAPTGVTGLGEGSAKMLALGYVYDLSKRTALYATAARITNDANTQFTVGGQTNGPSLLVDGQFLTGQTSTGYEVGIRHRF